MKKQEKFQIKSPAKINPFLHVLPIRKDRFHEVRLALVPINLYDLITFKFSQVPGLRLTVEGEEDLGDLERNTVYKAARAFEKSAGSVLSLEILLEKTIPSGAGLGGGSGNAAATLVLLNYIHGSPINTEELKSLALGLGSDVPFFLDPRPALAKGRGEKLTLLPQFPQLYLLVIKPPFAISTAEAYRLLRPREKERSLPPLTNLGEVLGGMENDFEEALFPRHPELSRLKTSLLEQGAKGALLSGSGSAMFGVFADAASRDAAASVIMRDSTSGSLYSCETLATHAYLPPEAKSQ